MQDHRAELVRFLAARTGDAAEAEDLYQTLWLKLGESAAGPIANPRSYLFQAANNLVIDHARARQRSMRRDHDWLTRDDHRAVHADPPDPARNAEQALLDAEEAAQVHRAIEALPAGARRALIAFRFEGLSQADIAARMGISRSGVEKHLALAMKHLRAHFAGCGYFTAVPSADGRGSGDGEP